MRSLELLLLFGTRNEERNSVIRHRRVTEKIQVGDWLSKKHDCPVSHKLSSWQVLHANLGRRQIRRRREFEQQKLPLVLCTKFSLTVGQAAKLPLIGPRVIDLQEILPSRHASTEIIGDIEETKNPGKFQGLGIRGNRG